MKSTEGQRTTHKRIREDVIETLLTDKIFQFSLDDLNTVLNGWKKIKGNFKKIGVKVSQNYFFEHPQYKKLFPSFAEVNEDDLERNEDFLTHSYAILKGINSVMMNLSAQYEEENEILPVIAYTHQKRGVTLDMMKHLKENFIFEEYLCKIYSEEKKEALEEA